MTLTLPWKPEVGEIIPAEWFWAVSDSTYWLYTKALYLQDQLNSFEDCVETELKEMNSLLNELLRSCKIPTKIATASKTVSTKPEPLCIEDINITAMVIKPSNLLYIGSYSDLINGKGFPLNANELVRIRIDDPCKIYGRSLEECNVFLIFELYE